METPKEKSNILFYQMLELNDETTSTEMMVEFAKLETKHLEQQIEKLEAEKAEMLEMLKYLQRVFEVTNSITTLKIKIYAKEIKSLIQKMEK